MDLIQLSKEKGFISRDNLIKVESDYKYLWMCELQKWLREVHNIHIEVNVNILREWYFTAYDLSAKRCSEIPEIYEKGKDFKSTTYEGALGKGLLESLKLIK